MKHKTKSTVSNKIKGTTAAVMPAFDAKLLARARVLIASREKLLKLEQEAQTELEQSTTKVALARADLGDAEVISQTNGHKPTAEAQEALQEAESNRTRLRALLQSVRTRLALQEGDLADAAHDMVTAQSEWASTVWQDFLKQEYRPALSAFREVLKHAERLAQAIGYPCALPLPEDVAINYAGSPLEEFAEPWTARQKLDKFLRDAESRYREKAKFDAYNSHYSNITISGSYRFRQTIAVNGRQYRQGAIVDSDVMHEGMLRRLVAVRHVVPITEAQS